MDHWTDGIETKVLAGYEAKGVKAAARCFAPAEPDGPCCALGALRNEDDTLPDVARGLGCLDKTQSWAFAYGFDCRMEERTKYTSFYAGQISFEAGYRTAEAVINAGLRE